ncbi:dipeptide ABC transporter ATP-binding protein [Lysinibacter cavernae]|uniref:Peptide/nickel transport system ATP-binding protein n=1 Tax=Lysinibacter cavernae TaxID=1640652 RepID=A0A7X5QZL9_9MICO|nr:ABC transporter ATP-binding protein [Lysinibacter cavernae]NIH52873.1 peptide/nickel transport system ATP-binding protein [Lysinibacter cavernae]
MTMDVVAELVNLRIASTERMLVDGVSLTVRAGECVAIVGESGSGKTLVTRSLIGLVSPELRVEADVLDLCGEDVRGLGEAGWRERRGVSVGLVSQDALLSLDPLQRIGNAVAEPLKVRGVGNRRDRRDRVTGLLERVKLPRIDSIGRAYPHELSGGLRQRALIAQGIAAGPRLLIADEPTTALDSTVQRHIVGLLRELTDDGMGLLLVSHDLGMVRDIADTVLVMLDGVVVERGTPDEILRAPQHPYTRRLVAAIPHGTAPVSTAISRTVLSAAGLRKSFHSPDGSVLDALKDASFSLGERETLGIVGESGSGKSTIARIVMCLERADAGSVLLNDEPWTALSERRRRPMRGHIQLVHQDPYSALNPARSVGASIAEALPHLQGAALRQRVDALLAKVGLEASLGGRLPKELSGGQRQRVAIARALAPEPAVLVCDEVVSALDVSVQADIIALLKQLQAEDGLSLMFISHDLAVVRELSHNLLVMRDGEIVEQGPTERVLAEPRHPFTRELIASSTSLRL